MVNRWHIYTGLKTNDLKRFLTLEQLEKMSAEEVKQGVIELMLQQLREETL